MSVVLQMLLQIQTNVRSSWDRVRTGQLLRWKPQRALKYPTLRIVQRSGYYQPRVDEAGLLSTGTRNRVQGNDGSAKVP